VSGPWLSTVEAAVTRLVGRREPLGTHVLDRTQVRRFQAVCAAGLAEAAPLSEDEVPALYLAAIFGWSRGMPETDGRVDGLSTTDAIGVALRDGELLGAGQSVQLHRPVRTGEQVTAVRVIELVRRKQGRSGEFLLVTVVRSVADEAGVEVCRCWETFIVRGPS
jgi:hydroxyacyl-ACP dehydratase HTD2-like protein with hotdog domain